METGSEAIASSARIDQFLALGVGKHMDLSTEINANDKGDNGSESPSHLPDDVLVQVGKSSFSYASKTRRNNANEGESYSPEAALTDIEFSLGRGELLMVVGSVGAVCD